MINIELNDNSQIELIDLNGQLVKQLELQSGLNTVDVSYLNRGVYLLRIANYSGSSISKIVLQ